MQDLEGVLGGDMIGFLDALVEADLYTDRETALRGVVRAVMNGIERKSRTRYARMPRPRTRQNVPLGRFSIEMIPLDGD